MLLRYHYRAGRSFPIYSIRVRQSWRTVPSTASPSALIAEQRVRIRRSPRLRLMGQSWRTFFEQASNTQDDLESGMPCSSRYGPIGHRLLGQGGQ